MTLRPDPASVSPSPHAATLEYAEWWRRAVAWLLDAIPAAVFYSVLWTVDVDRLTGTTSIVWTAVQALLSLYGLANLILLQGITGSSIGQRAVGVVILDIDDRHPIGIIRNFLRGCMHLFDTITLGVGWLWPLWDRRHQTFADKIMHTIVVRRTREASAR